MLLSCLTAISAVIDWRARETINVTIWVFASELMLSATITILALLIFARNPLVLASSMGLYSLALHAPLVRATTKASAFQFMSCVLS
jgi:hypothetical protein